MIINVNNLGLLDPNIKLEGKYLNSKGNAPYDSNEKSYKLTSSDVTLLKIDISSFDTNLLVSNGKLRLKIKGIKEGGAIFKLYEIDSVGYSKSTAPSVVLYSLIDAINYSGIASKYGSKIEDIIEFDLTKYLYNKVKGLSNVLYFAITCNSPTYRVFSIQSLVNSEVLFSMQLNALQGLDSSYEYDQEEIGFAGVSNINLANGKMIHKFEAIQTLSEDNPAAFHLYFNKDQTPRIKILGENWTYSGDYGYNLDNEKFIIKLIDPSQRTIILHKCDEDTIKETYGISKLVNGFENEEYYICLSEPLYAVVNASMTSNCIFVDKSENKMIFGNPSGYYRLTKIELCNGKSIEYEYDSEGYPTKIKNSDGEFLLIYYSSTRVSSVNIHKKDGTKLGKMTFEYKNNRISSIKSYFGSSDNVIDEATFTYDSSFRIGEINDVTAGIGSQFNYSSSNQVVRIDHFILGDKDKNKFTEYDYFTFQTRVTSYTGLYRDYYFDYFGRCKNIIDCEAKSITRNYDEVIDGNPGNLKSESKLQINERNLIDNHSFDGADGLFDSGSSWTLVNGDSSKIKIVGGGVYGQKCLRIEKNTMDNIIIKQVLKDVAKGVYVFRGFLKAIAKEGSTLTSGCINAKLAVKYDEAVTTTTTDKSNNTITTTNVYTREKNYELKNTLNGTFDWYEYRKNAVIIPGGTKISNLSVILYIELTGNNYTAYFDDLSLTYGDHIVRHNFVNNGYFENDTSGWLFENNTSQDKIITIGTSKGHHAVLGAKVLRLTSNLEKIKTVYRKIDMLGSAGDELLLNIFGKGNVSSNDIFRAFIKIHYIDTDDIKKFNFDFDPNYEYWQVLTRKLIADRAYDYAEIGVEVRSKSDVYLDAIQLYKDSFGKEYSYTEKKNMSEMVNSDGTCANISYDEKSNITEVTDESGDTYRYTYDDNKKVTQITNNQNAKVLFTYDKNCGKKKETKIISNKGESLKTSQSYDNQGRVISQTDDSGSVTSFSYDEYDRKITETSANGLVTSFKYNANNMLQEQLSKLGRINQNVLIPMISMVISRPSLVIMARSMNLNIVMRNKLHVLK